MGKLRPGSEQHRKFFCKAFTDSFESFEVRDLKWPQLDSEALARLRALPFWREAIRTERVAGERVRKMADYERDPLIREAIAMQSYEEARHARMIESLMQHCGIPIPDIAGDKPRDAEWGFIRMGYGEVFDSFFAFGLFRIAGETGFFPPELMDAFEVFMQEEARHVIFFQNWAAFRDRSNLLTMPWFKFRRSLAVAIQALGRIQTAIQLRRGTDSQEDFVLNPDAIDRGVSIKRFIETCLNENERRMVRYDAKLLRPRLVPWAASTALKLMRDANDN
jgi:hypothetical protein